jgi:DNA helicase-2/ATP-dependent DNA helicase PcrA
MNSETFQKSYNSLNLAQRAAVDAIEGPVMVVAGPGTGKTQILTLRIANILEKSDASPDSILALTFTEAAARSMRKRLVSIIGAPGYRVRITTFHGFCNEVISSYPESFPHIIGSVAATDVDQIDILTKLLETLPLMLLRPLGDPLYYLKPLKGHISQLKRENISPDQYKNLVAIAHENLLAEPDLYHEKGAHKGKMKGVYQDAQKRIERAKEAVLVYEAYERELRARKLYDFEDMILEVVRVFEGDGDLLLRLQEEYQYILADEHQDANGAQNKLLEYLANFHESPNLFVVGDEKQAIYRFQGALSETFTDFKNKYPDAKVITLSENYRSTQTILDAAGNVLLSKLDAKAGHAEKKITLRSFSKKEYEYRALAQDLAGRMSDGERGNVDAVILYRNNRDAKPIIMALEREGVPFVVQSDQEILGDNDIQKLLTLFRAVDSYPDEASFAKALHLDFLMRDEFEIYKALDGARKERKNLYEILRSDPLAVQMKAWHKKARNDSLSEFFAEIVRESGFLTHLLRHQDARTKMRKLDILFSEVQNLVEAKHGFRLNDFMSYLATLEQNGISLEKSLGGDGAGVRLMTVHKSKGLEFDAVYIVNAVESSWAGKAKADLFDLRVEPEKEDLSPDERRLLYVALTRARKEIIISYSNVGDSGREVLPARFLSEIDGTHVSEEDMSEIEERFVETPEYQFKKLPPKPESMKDVAFLRELFDAQGLSVTSLGNYLDCPWKFFYRNLIRIPEAKTNPLMFGTAVHAALKDFFDALREDEPMSKKDFLEKFRYYAGREPFSERDLADILKKGEDALSGYYDTYHKTWDANVLSEFPISGVLLDDIKLVGKLDKIELINGGPSVNVVDYKTGKPKSTKQVEDAGYRRQLVFYKILLERFDDGKKFKMISGDIDFVEPDAKGNYKKERMIISDDEVRELEEKIREVAAEIRTLAFWDKKCDDKECEYCALRETMKS